VCSRQQRQREYWQDRGKQMRKRRLKTRDPANRTKPHKKRKERKP
jgi:hypothetical protein